MNDDTRERQPSLDEPRQVSCAWCGVVMRVGVLPASHTVCPACKAGVLAGLDCKDDSATLSRIETGERWWQAWGEGDNRVKGTYDGNPPYSQKTLEHCKRYGLSGEVLRRALLAGERARRDEVQERFDEFQRREAVAAYVSAGGFTLVMLVLSWLLMAW